MNPSIEPYLTAEEQAFRDEARWEAAKLRVRASDAVSMPAIRWEAAKDTLRWSAIAISFMVAAFFAFMAIFGGAQ